MWDDACIESGQTVIDCNNFKERNDGNDKEDLDDLGNENMDKCWDDGYEDVQNNPFNQERNEGCSDYQNMYYKGFIAGCESVEGNIKETCDRSMKCDSLMKELSNAGLLSPSVLHIHHGVSAFYPFHRIFLGTDFQL